MNSNLHGTVRSLLVMMMSVDVRKRVRRTWMRKMRIRKTVVRKKVVVRRVVVKRKAVARKKAAVRKKAVVRKKAAVRRKAAKRKAAAKRRKMKIQSFPKKKMM